MEDRKTNRIRWLSWQLIYGCGIAGSVAPVPIYGMLHTQQGTETRTNDPLLQGGSSLAHSDCLSRAESVAPGTDPSSCLIPSRFLPSWKAALNSLMSL